jgi:hypothetical protein
MGPAARRLDAPAGRTLFGALLSLLHRLPPAREIRHAFLACLVPIVAWSAVHTLLDGLEGWSRQMRLWDVIGVIAYVQVFALAESIVVFLPLVLLSLALPPSWFRDRFVGLAVGIVYLSAAWFVLAQLNDDTLRGWGSRELLPWVAAYAASLLLLGVIIHRNPRLDVIIGSFVERISVLASAYLVLLLAALVIVLIRIL